MADAVWAMLIALENRARPAHAARVKQLARDDAKPRHVQQPVLPGSPCLGFFRFSFEWFVTAGIQCSLPLSNTPS
jgi:hypothetical protein